MSIDEKLKTIAGNQRRVYEAGRAAGGGGGGAFPVIFTSSYNADEEIWSLKASATPIEMIEAVNSGKYVYGIFQDSTDVMALSYLNESQAQFVYLAPDETYIYGYYVYEDGSAENYDSDYVEYENSLVVYLDTNDEGDLFSSHNSHDVFWVAQSGGTVVAINFAWDNYVYTLASSHEEQAIFTRVCPHENTVYSIYIDGDGAVEESESLWITSNEAQEPDCYSVYATEQADGTLKVYLSLTHYDYYEAFYGKHKPVFLCVWQKNASNGSNSIYRQYPLTELEVVDAKNRILKFGNAYQWHNKDSDILYPIEQ